MRPCFSECKHPRSDTSEAPTVPAWTRVVFLEGLELDIKEQFANLQGILVHCKLKIYSLRYLYGKVALKGTF